MDGWQRLPAREVDSSTTATVTTTATGLKEPLLTH